MNDKKQKGPVFQLTDADRERYEAMIKRVSLPLDDKLLSSVAKKLETFLEAEDPNIFEVSLLQNISKLYVLIRDQKNVPDDLMRRIGFALEYFVLDDDDIPDEIPGLGYMDDAVVVRWIVDQILVDYPEHFTA
ncbi:MAG: DUF1232 domain-containing protein [Fidelibacterota bacterium]